ncbi:ABC transporter ATP-binding protein [Bordetella genomosp. 8]|uniref:ABC transporter ATP-binding protein n=1 Tax=Bordetella genomosp. 8 TaxID=1416806 RepID=A0A1W6YTX6_9BORD|nr:zinc ABC transporter ATP-binding protein AztA [Bordetella genomosp. 8]ARP84053.1 ABC transporter ATP-binding protein [Bordetella genomosp. 8]
MVVGTGRAPARISLEAASFGWRGRRAVSEVSGSFMPGTMTAIVGPNGAGKSTLIKGVMGVVRPMSGRVTVSGAGRRDLAWLPQAAELDKSFPITVHELVAMGAWRRVGAWRRFGADERERVRQALEAVGLGGAGDRIVGTLSGGQLQRALFARLLLQDADVLLLDEPFAAVDTHTVDDLMRLLAACHGQGRTIVAVLHDLELVRAHFPHTLLLSGDVVAWGPTAEVLTDANLRTARQLRDRELA